MSNAELAFNLSQRVGWPHTQAEWDMMADVGSLMTIGSPEKIYASALLTQYNWGSSLGMVLVDPNERGFGLGASITRQVFAATEADDVKVVVLTASHDAEKLYQKVGFEQIGSVMVLKRAGVPLENLKADQGITCTAEEVSAAYYDSCPVRKRALERIMLMGSPAVGLRDKDGNIEGFASSIKRVARNGSESLAIGPILANDSTKAGRLLDQFMASTSLDMTCFAFQNFIGETQDATIARTSILEEFQSRNFIKSDELKFMSHNGKTVDLFLSSRIVSPMSLAFS